MCSVHITGISQEAESEAAGELAERWYRQMSFIENLFFGNIDPQSRAVRTGSRADKLRTLITDHLPEIENALPDEQRGVLERIRCQ